MNAPGFVTLGQIAGCLADLEASCKRCDRRGRLRVDRLLAEHGAALPVPELRHILTADCPGFRPGGCTTCRGAFSRVVGVTTASPSDH